MTESEARRQNHILGALPEHNDAYLSTLLELVNLASGDLIYEPGKRPHYAYFPTADIVSNYYINTVGASTEITTTSKAGMRYSWAVETTPNRVVVMASGHACLNPSGLKIRSYECYQVIKPEFDRLWQFH